MGQMLEREYILKRIKEEGPARWYHNFEIVKDSDIYTCPEKPKTNVGSILKKLKLNETFFKGRRVLDIGAFSGAFSFYFEELGAEVLAIDIQDPHTNGFSLVHEVRNSKVEHCKCSIYDLHPDMLGHFDVILFMGIFYHLKHPILALERINSVCVPEALLIGSGTTSDSWFHNEDKSCAKGADFTLITKESVKNDKALSIGSLNELALCGYTSKHLYKNYSNWFLPNKECLKGWFETTGFKVDKLVLEIRRFPSDWNLPDIHRSLIYFTAKHVSEPLPEYHEDSYASYRKTNGIKKAVSLYKIPTQCEVKKLLNEVHRLQSLLAEHGIEH